MEPGRRIGAQRDRPSTMGPRCLCAAPTSIIFFIFRIKSSLRYSPLTLPSSSPFSIFINEIMTIFLSFFPPPRLGLEKREFLRSRDASWGASKSRKNRGERGKRKKPPPLSVSNDSIRTGAGVDQEKRKRERETEICTTMNSEGWS